MEKKVILEVCCGSLDDAIVAEASGADRIELNSCLFQGGLTPSFGCFLKAKEKIKIPVMVMVRPRGAGFCYTDAEFEVMLEDAHHFVHSGADGIVFGFLNENGTVDFERCKRIIEIIGEKEAVFHRAIDVVPDPIAALDKLSTLGVKRVLTSGQKPTAPEGAHLIKEMVNSLSGKMEILPGGGIRAGNVSDIIKVTGVDQVHLAALGTRMDRSTCGNMQIYYGGALYPPEDRHQIADGDALKNIIERMRT